MATALNKTTCFLLLFASIAAALPPQEARNAVQTENDLLDSIYTDCLRKDSISCLKYKLFSFVDKMLGHKDTITLTDGVQIVKSGEGEPEGAPRALSADDSVESLLLGRISAFLDSHTIKVDLKGSDIVGAVASTARSFNEALAEEAELTEEGRKKSGGGGGGGKKGNKMMGPLMAAAALKAAVLAKLALAAIALIAGKALLIGKIALVLSAIIGLKKLLGGGGKHVTYEVVSHPQHSASHVSSHETVYSGGGSGSGGYGGGAEAAGGGYGSSGHGGGWGRSFDAANLAYRAHLPPATQQ